MLYYLSDYTEGARPRILERLQESNLVSQPGYGEDCFCASAREKIRAACGCPDAAVEFLVGGTQVNRTVIAAVLRPQHRPVRHEVFKIRPRVFVGEYRQAQRFERRLQRCVHAHRTTSDKIRVITSNELGKVLTTR